MEQWKKLALAEEKDPHLRKIIKEGPKGLSHLGITKQCIVSMFPV